MVGARIDKVEQRRPDLRFPFPERFAERLEKQTIVSLGRRAKYLLADLSNGDVLVMHLGMTGRFTVDWPRHGGTAPGDFHHEAGGIPAHDHVVFHLSNGVRVLMLEQHDFPTARATFVFDRGIAHASSA